MYPRRKGRELQRLTATLGGIPLDFSLLSAIYVLPRGFQHNAIL